ncbi:MAG: hypothetical protein ACOYNY_16580 [Caldilineaceae bacterium]
MAIQNPYDHALKILARTWPEQFLQLGFPNQPFRLLGAESNVELAMEIDRVDFLHELEINNRRAFLHIDFQLEHDNECQRRFFVYNAMLTEVKKPVPVITLPVYIRPRVKALPNSYEVKVGELVAHKFSYQPIQLWDYVAQIRSGELYIFAPLLPVLMQPPTEALLREERDLILRCESDPERQRTLLTTAILIAAQSKLFDPDFLWALFKEDAMDLDNPILVRLLDRAYGKQLADEVEKRLAEEVAKERKMLASRFADQVAEQAAEQVTAATQRALAAEAAQRKAEVEAAQRKAEVEAAQRKAEVEAAQRKAEAEAAQQWHAMALKILEHRFTSAPVALVVLLQTVTPAQRSPVTDRLLDAPTADACLHAVREFLHTPNDGAPTK